jgi:hypothetical protein
MTATPFDWPRGPRASFTLGTDKGVYALFLSEGAVLPELEVGEGGLLYIGLAAGERGFEGRDHFDARTANHSPRKSLAVLLMKELELKPTLVPKRNGRDTWGLDRPSDERLTKWMHSHLELALEIGQDPKGRETELVRAHAPPLNLTICDQQPQHQSISAAEAR